MLLLLGLRGFIAQPATLAALGVTGLLAWPAGRRFAARFRCRTVVAVAFVVTVGVILSLTLTPNPPPDGVYLAPPPHYLWLLLHDRAALWAQFSLPPRDSEQLANVLLYLPAGLLGALAWRSVLQAGLFGTALTVAVETCQYGIIGRAGSITDIRNNALGAILGALTAAAMRRFVRNRTTADGRGQMPAAPSPT